MDTTMAGQVNWKSNPDRKVPMGCYRGESVFSTTIECRSNKAQDQWNQFTVHEVGSQPYGRPLSTVFPGSGLHTLDEDGDPTIASLQFIDYRYLRFFYHPLEDRFSLITGWKDPSWTNVRSMRGGLDADERDSREQLFERNAIEIYQKTVPQLLVDEVGSLFLLSMEVT